MLKGIDVRRRRLRARFDAVRSPHLFADVETMCCFVGHTKSGGSLLGAMLDAHPDAVVADEVDVLDHLEAGFTRAEIFRSFVRGARREAMKGRVTARRLGGYSLAIDGQWQGRYRAIRVIGESRAGPTTRRLGSDGASVSRLRDLAAPARVRLLHVVRNPLDPIAAMVVRGGRSIEAATADYDAQAHRVEQLRAHLASEELRAVHYEDLLVRPNDTVVGVLEHLGLDVEETYVAACSGLVDPRRPGERHRVEWSSRQLDQVRQLVDAHEFLAHYRDGIVVEVGACES